MDWTLAITRNREALLRIIAALYAFAGLANGATFSVLPRQVYRAMLRTLRPAESAVRRLIILLAHGMVLRAVAARAAPVGLSLNPNTSMRPAFPLIDPLKRFAPIDDTAENAFEFVDFEEEKADFMDGARPRISIPGLYDPVFVAPIIPRADDPINAAHISRRLLALSRALSNLNAQARRLARWQMRRDLALQSDSAKPHRISPFRPGSPPGARLKRRLEIDHILRECHALVFDRMVDTS